jgi:hypothetical protein
MNKTVTNIVIKNYQEFTEEVQVEGVSVNHVVIAKEVEAIVQIEGEEAFSLGFSVMRNNPIFDFESPRRIVQNFLLNNFNFNIDTQE